MKDQEQPVKTIMTYTAANLILEGTACETRVVVDESLAVGTLRVELEATPSRAARIGCRVGGVVLSADLRLSGTGDVHIASLTGGDLHAHLSGTGDAEVEGGDVGALRVDTTGTGDFRFDGRAASADLRSSGTGGIRVREVTGKVSQRSTGTGRIRANAGR